MNQRILTAAALLPVALAAASSQPTLPPPPAGAAQARHFRFQHENVLGTSLDLTLQAPTLAAAKYAEAAVLATFDHDQAALSTWRADSEASRWARTRFTPVPVSPELFAVLAAFDHWREATNGALDASVEAATRLWRSSTAEGRTPTVQQIAQTTEAMQQPHWSLDPVAHTATRLTDVPLAFATFTKSYITERASQAALRAGATGVMLNVGGDLVVRGNLTQLVAIADPRAADENDPTLTHVAIRDRAVATSGDYRRNLTLAGQRFSHIIDPRTAQPASHILSSTVIARDAVTAGALATAFSVLPVAASQALAAQQSADLQYLLVLASGEQVRSANWPGPRLARISPAAYAPPIAAPAGMWNPAFELSLDLTLPRMDDARYRRPYVAVWIEDADHFPVRTLALWHQNPKWLPDLKQWYRDDQVRHLAEGSDVSKTISSATRPPGKYNLKWDGKDNEGKPVKAGKYTICIEAAREHGGYDLERHELDFNGQPQQAMLPAAKEFGVATLDYRKR